MRWSVIIPTWRRSSLLRATLDSLRDQGREDFEVVVVSDGEDAPTRALADAYRAPFALRWVHHAENRGQAAARNTGAGVARGDLLLFLDDDTLAAPGLLASHDREHAAAPAWPSCAVLGRTIEERRVPVASRTDAYVQRAWERALATTQPSHARNDLASVDEHAEAAVWFGLNGSIARALFHEAGGFDARLRSDEDMELGWRLYRRGVLFRYAPDATVRHQDSKAMHDYFARCWRESGAQDVYRAREKGERGAQIGQLARVRHGSVAARRSARFAARHPRSLLAAASALERVTDVTGSRVAFALWARLRRTGEYWSGVKESGVRDEDLASMAGAEGRIVAFHSISAPRSRAETPYCTSPARFRRLLAWLPRLGRVPVAPRRWLAGDLPANNVLFTFDDGYADVYTEVFPAMAGSGLSPLVFVVVDRIGATNDWEDGRAVQPRKLLSLGQMRELQRHGVVFGAHSLSHPSLPALCDAELRRQVTDSRRCLEDLLGAAVEWFAYPYGEVDRRVRAAVAEAGYAAAVTTRPGLNGWQDPLALKRFEVCDRDTPLGLVHRLR
jgi:GT2 family glycosyltransferase/peptidoglycan/xylan/chitin deacetylase (PgdA/CDA1 family)